MMEMLPLVAARFQGQRICDLSPQPMVGISISGNTASENDIVIEQKGKTVYLVCTGGNNETRWKKDGVNLTPQGKKLMLAVMDDPRGIYQCLDRDEKNRTLQVFIRMCQYCIHLDFTTILGISVASLLATVFLAIAVYHLAVEERSRPAQASDKQSLLANDQLYQPLQERNDRPYSHIAITKPRRR
ncbi:T-cell surface glycoprotein CD3 gamma chain isoform X1 [Pseudonaja textilis]|uniref:T-cell surface glycoprotein CD3 gamma chain isoform X1 n=1 Tax=Pseudonaja textilis TaxID=8673 RepID=UPI000EAA321C|nr:T-cell surface glycoprotein CD3 gamma chain isoform X1 [Pseudonaja textilis]